MVTAKLVYTELEKHGATPRVVKGRLEIILDEELETRNKFESMEILMDIIKESLRIEIV